MFYDSFILFGLLMGATAALLPFNHGQTIPQGTLSYQLYLIVVMYLYFDICWRKGGQTIGMRAWRIRLISTTGRPVTRWQTTLRFLTAFISAACLGLGYLFHWHDRASHTELTLT